MLIAGMACLCSAASSIAFAIAEKDLWGAHNKELFRFMEADGEGLPTFKTADGQYIAYRAFNQKCGDTAVIIVNGRTEFQLKYAEIIWDLYRRGYCVFSYDHRGQGLSSRLLEDHQKGYIKHFSDYLTDLGEFDRRIVRTKPFNRVYLLGHSMGGLIASQYAAKAESNLAGLILLAPMLDIKTAGVPSALAHLVVWYQTKSGRGERYSLRQGPWDPKRDSFETNKVTSSEARYEFTKEVYARHPETVMGGCTNRWLLEAIRATDKSLALASKIRAPILLLQAAKDTFVKNPRQVKFCSRAGNCALRVVANSKHEILFEADPIRDYALGEIFRFIDTH